MRKLGRAILDVHCIIGFHHKEVLFCLEQASNFSWQLVPNRAWAIRAGSSRDTDACSCQALMLSDRTSLLHETSFNNLKIVAQVEYNCGMT